jgi:hypothetical protein
VKQFIVKEKIFIVVRYLSTMLFALVLSSPPFIIVVVIVAVIIFIFVIDIVGSDAIDIAFIIVVNIVIIIKGCSYSHSSVNIIVIVAGGDEHGNGLLESWQPSPAAAAIIMLPMAIFFFSIM